MSANYNANVDDVAADLNTPRPIVAGGTGATTAAGALTALGAAPLASPVLTGDPQAPTPTAGDSDTSIATTAFVGIAVANVAVRYDIAQTLTANQKAQGRANIGSLKRNYIINGAMMISQENGSNAGTANPYYPVDQFTTIFFNTTVVLSSSQVSSRTSGGSTNRLRVSVTTADTIAANKTAYIRQPFEGFRVADLLSGTAAAKTITAQFGCKAPAGTYCWFIQNYTGAAPNRSYVAEFVIAAGEANIDVIKSVTIPLDQAGVWPSDAGGGMYVGISLMCGSVAQAPANAWQAGNFTGTANQFNFAGTAGNVFELFDVGVYEGTVAPAFQVPDYASELALCQRYYWKEPLPTWIYAEGVSIGAGATNLIFTVRFPVTMRATPTITLPASFSSVGVGALSTTTLALPSPSAASITAAATAASGGRMYFLYVGGAFVANARL